MPDMMIIVYSEKHKLHDPEYMVVAGRQEPHCEVPRRLESIIKSASEYGFPIIQPRSYSLNNIRTVHSADYVRYLSEVYDCWVKANMPEQGVIPDTFPSRFLSTKPVDPIAQAGWYCFDTCAPIVKHTYEAAVDSAYCALTGADLLLEGEKSVYSLCRPPGHHAGTDYCGGFCYFNNAAIAAVHLINENLTADRQVRIAILDIDFHHGNGTQQIFDKDDNVLFVSIHADPDFDFPYFWGSKHEREDDDRLSAINIPLRAGTTEGEYIKALSEATESIARFRADYLIVSLGVDTYEDDPIGSFNLETGTYGRIGQCISRMAIPTLIVQEGGYNTDEIGTCVTNFLLSF